MTFRRPIAVTDIQYVVEISEDLTVWHTGDGYVEPVSAAEYADQPEMVCYGVQRSIQDGQSMFMRVRTVYTP